MLEFQRAKSQDACKCVTIFIDSGAACGVRIFNKDTELHRQHCDVRLDNDDSHLLSGNDCDHEAIRIIMKRTIRKR